MKILALSFLILIGFMLVVEGLHQHIPRGYVYFAMAFSLAVEFLNMRLRKVSEPVHLHQTYVEVPPGGAAPGGAAGQR
jgi:predicted tellurium resistance membrane protein TerC